MENDPLSSAAKDYYLPGELGLDVEKQEDLDLYVQSGGDKVVGTYLLRQREARRGYDTGEESYEAYQARLRDLDAQIAQRQEEIGCSPPRPQ